MQRTEYEALAAESPNVNLLPLMERIEDDLKLLRVMAGLPVAQSETRTPKTP